MPHAHLEQPSAAIRAKDWLNRLLRGELHLPPWWLRDVGGANFEAVGQEFLHLFQDVVNLQATENVLEIGCGSGRIALALSQYLSPPGHYLGMDITANSIRWCQRHITPKHPHFHFLHADLYNKRYNPQGRHQAHEYTFPLQGDHFDFIFLTSVFTHLLPPASGQYLREIARLLHPQGRALVTFFLLNPSQAELAQQGKNDINFAHSLAETDGACQVRDLAVPESAIAYDEDFLLDFLAAQGLTLAQNIEYGTWRGSGQGLSYQDILILKRLS